MTNQFSKASKSFIILFLVALVGTLVCLEMFSREPVYNPVGFLPQNRNNNESANTAGNDEAAIDVSGWKSYNNSTYHFSFLYDPTWKISAPKKQDGYQVVQIDPGPKYYNMKIYISPDGYYAMAGLNSKIITVGGEKATDIDGLLYGVQSGQYYYTFDIGQSTVLKPQFDAMVHSLAFSN